MLLFLFICACEPTSQLTVSSMNKSLNQYKPWKQTNSIHNTRKHLPPFSECVIVRPPLRKISLRDQVWVNGQLMEGNVFVVYEFLTKVQKNMLLFYYRNLWPNYFNRSLRQMFWINARMHIRGDGPHKTNKTSRIFFSSDRIKTIYSMKTSVYFWKKEIKSMLMNLHLKKLIVWNLKVNQKLQEFWFLDPFH